MPDFSHESPRGIPAGRRKDGKKKRKEDGRNSFDGNSCGSSCHTFNVARTRFYCGRSTLRFDCTQLHRQRCRQRFARVSPLFARIRKQETRSAVESRSSRLFRLIGQRNAGYSRHRRDPRRTSWDAVANVAPFVSVRLTAARLTDVNTATDCAIFE